MENTANSNTNWFYEDNGERKGPVTESSIIEMINSMKITYGSLIWKSGLPEWIKVENSELLHYLEKVSPPPITGKHVSNAIVWVLAFAPIIGYFLESAVAYAMNGSDDAANAAIDGNKYWFITLALNLVLSYSDAGKLKKAGYDTSKFKGFAWLIPVYLFKRAKALKQNIAYFVVWLVCFALTLLATS